MTILARNRSELSLKSFELARLGGSDTNLLRAPFLQNIISFHNYSSNRSIQFYSTLTSKSEVTINLGSYYTFNITYMLAWEIAISKSQRPQESNAKINRLTSTSNLTGSLCDRDTHS